MKKFMLCFCILFSAISVQAQHEHALPPNTIDGSKNPERIPDKTAYRLYFVSVADSKHSDIYFKTLGLTAKDVLSASNALTNFKTQYDALVTDYNNSASTLNGTNGETASFLAKRDALVDSTRAAFAKVLSTTGMTSLDSHVQSEKRHMQYSHDSILTSSRKEPKLVLAAFHPHPQGPPPCGMTPVYDDYINFSIDSAHPYTLYSTAVVEGYTQVSGYCASLHHGAVWNNMDSDGNPFQYGSNVTPPSYISVSNSDSEGGSPGQVFNNVYSVQIICSTAGTFFNASFSLQIEIAHTRVTESGQPWTGCSGVSVVNCDIPVITWCTNDPPDMNITAVRSEVSPVPPPSFWDAFGIGIRFSPTDSWHFNNLSTYVIGIASMSPRVACTQSSAGIP